MMAHDLMVMVLAYGALSVMQRRFELAMRRQRAEMDRIVSDLRSRVSPLRGDIPVHEEVIT